MRSRVAVALIAVLAVTTAGCDVSLWPMFHDDALHAGVSSDTAVGASTVAGLSLRWKTLVTSGQQVKSSPAGRPASDGANGWQAALAQGKSLCFVKSSSP